MIIPEMKNINYCQFQHQHYYNNVFVKILPDEESHYERFPGGAAPWLTPRRGCIATLSQQTPSSRSRSSPGPGCRTSSGIIGGRSLYGDWFNTALFELGTGVRVGGNVSSVQVTTDDPEGEMTKMVVPYFQPCLFVPSNKKCLIQC